LNYITHIRRLGKLLLLLCCFWLLTGPLLLLQLGAWSWMLASYSQESSFEQAIIETFGGDRPCEICKFIQTIDTESTPRPKQKANDHSDFKLITIQAADTPTKLAHFSIAIRKEKIELT
jgi:hypothetical protein